VTSIGDFAFKDCASLKDIMIPDSVKSIGSQAFDGCHSLRWATVPHHLIGCAPFPRPTRVTLSQGPECCKIKESDAAPRLELPQEAAECDTLDVICGPGVLSRTTLGSCAGSSLGSSAGSSSPRTSSYFEPGWELVD
jgi:hypothetical protein